MADSQCHRFCRGLLCAVDTRVQEKRVLKKSLRACPNTSERRRQASTGHYRNMRFSAVGAAREPPTDTVCDSGVDKPAGFRIGSYSAVEFAIDRQKRHWALRSPEETPRRGVFTLCLCTAQHSRRVVVRPQPQRMMRPVTATERSYNHARALLFQNYRHFR